MTSNARLDGYLSQIRDLPFTETERRYLICSSPRCGSTLFGQMLFDTNVMGDPLEYLNPAYAAAFFRRFPGHSNSVADVLRRLEVLRTGASGNFGLQLHFSHFHALFPDDKSKAGFLDRFDKLVFMRRRDKLAQAASLCRATRSGLWSSLEEDMRREAGTPSQDGNDELIPTEFTNTLAAIVAQDLGWENLLAGTKRAIMTVFYEDLIADWPGQCARVISWLGGDVSEEDVPTQALRKQAAASDLSLLKVAEYLGCILPR